MNAVPLCCLDSDFFVGLGGAATMRHGSHLSGRGGAELRFGKGLVELESPVGCFLRSRGISEGFWGS